MLLKNMVNFLKCVPYVAHDAGWDKWLFTICGARCCECVSLDVIDYKFTDISRLTAIYLLLFQHATKIFK